MKASNLVMGCELLEGRLLFNAASPPTVEFEQYVKGSGTSRTFAVYYDGADPIDKKTLDLLQAYDWPGNIRELQNVIERSVILSSGGVFAVDELWLTAHSVRPAPQTKPYGLLHGDPRGEREIIEAALAESRGRISGPSGAAARLNIPPSTLEHRIRALKIRKSQFKFR